MSIPQMVAIFVDPDVASGEWSTVPDGMTVSEYLKAKQNGRFG